MLPAERARLEGLAAAVLAYVSWGFLSPGAKLLLEHAGPWTINFHRTWLSLLVFLLLFGLPRTARALHALGRDARLWVLGIGGLGLTFTFFMYSVDRLEPTVATVLVYFAPLLVAWGAHRFLGEHLDAAILPTALLTLLGVTIAVFEPTTGFDVAVRQATGLALGILGVLGWAFYTLYLRHVGARYPEGEITLSAFAASGVLFLLGAALLEGFAFDANPRSLLLMATYVLFPSVASFLLYSVAVRRTGAAVASVLIGIELLATAVISRLLVGEDFSLEKVFGLLLVAAAVTWFLWRQRVRARREAGGSIQAAA